MNVPHDLTLIRKSGQKSQAGMGAFFKRMSKNLQCKIVGQSLFLMMFFSILKFNVKFRILGIIGNLLDLLTSSNPSESCPFH
jgi:hypothetical protein